MMADDTPCYVGIKECGCVVAAVVDVPEHRKETAKAVQEWIRDGLQIERQTVTWVREHFTKCTCGQLQPSTEAGA